MWQRVLTAAGWSPTATLVDANPAITRVSAAVLPDGTLHLLTVVPGKGVWDRALTRGRWAENATRVETSGAHTDVSAAVTGGVLHALTVVPGSGIWHRTYTAGTWAARPIRVDQNGSISDVSAAVTGGVLHALTVVPGSGIWHRTHAADTWAVGSAFVPGTRAGGSGPAGDIVSVSSAGRPDGTLRLAAVVNGGGVAEFVRAGGTWSGPTPIDAHPSVLDGYLVRLPDGTLHLGTVVDLR